MAIQGGAVIPMSPYAERLASVPQIPRAHTTGDGTEPGGGQSQQLGAGPQENPQAPPTLLDASVMDQFRTIDQLARSQDRLRKNRFAIDQYHSWLDANVQFGRLDKIPNQNIWLAKLAPGVSVERSAAVPNKSADLCNKVTDTLLADPPKPNPRQTDSEGSDAAGDLVSDILRQISGESGINEIQQYRWAFRNALTRSSSFLEYDVDTKGGGYQPWQVLADPNSPGVDTQTGLALPPIDPTSGQPIAAVNPTLRYASAQGQYVTDPSQADRVWLPKLVTRKHQRTKVMLWPPEADIEDATHALLSDSCSLDEMRKRWPDTVGAMTSVQLQALTQWRPTFADMTVPFIFRGGIAEGMTGPTMDDVGSLSPLLTKRVYFYRFWVKANDEYPQGFLLDMNGANGGTLLGQDTLDFTVQMPKGGTDTRCRDIPLVQVTPNQDVEGMDPTGWPFQGRFDGSAQTDARIMGHYIDALERMANPHVFIESVTAFDEDEWFDRGKPTIIGPGQRAPYYEQFSPLPPVVQVSEYLQTRQDTASGLTATAQGLDSENAQSGIAKRLTVRQAQISLAGMQQQLHGAFTRGWRLSAQWIQAKFTIKQLIKATGENSSDEETWWNAEDFADVDDIGIEPGTGTMMTAEDKANYVRFLQDSQWMTPEQAADIGVAGIARDLGLPKDAIKAAIDRSIGVWLKGPPNPEWAQQWQQYKQQLAIYTQAMQQFQQATQIYTQGQQMRATAAGGPPLAGVGPEQQNASAMDMFQQATLFLQMHPEVLGPPPAPPQIQPPTKPWTPFVDRPNDTEPAVATKWAKSLSHFQFTPEYESFGPEWRQCCDDKYTQTRQAAAMAGGMAPQPQAHERRAPAQPNPAAQVAA